MTASEITLPPVQTLTEDDIYTQEARIRAAEKAKQAWRIKDTHTDFTHPHLENVLSPEAELRLGAAGLTLTTSSSAEFNLPTDEN